MELNPFKAKRKELSMPSSPAMLRRVVFGDALDSDYSQNLDESECDNNQDVCRDHVTHRVRPSICINDEKGEATPPQVVSGRARASTSAGGGTWSGRDLERARTVLGLGEAMLFPKGLSHGVYAREWHQKCANRSRNRPTSNRVRRGAVKSQNSVHRRQDSGSLSPALPLIGSMARYVSPPHRSNTVVGVSRKLNVDDNTNNNDKSDDKNNDDKNDDKNNDDEVKQEIETGYSTEDLPADWTFTAAQQQQDDDNDSDSELKSASLSMLLNALSHDSDSSSLLMPSTPAAVCGESAPVGYTPAPWQFCDGDSDDTSYHLFADADNDDDDNVLKAGKDGGDGDDDGDDDEDNNAIDSQQLLKDWMAEYRELLTLPDEVKFERIWKLTSDFRLAAETYARVIVSELPLPLAQKTIKPADVGGCSGDKYIVSGMLIKVLSDSVLLDDIYMFGGAAGRNDAAAVKTASLELMHTEHVNGQLAERRDMMTAIVCVVDWMGHRVLSSCLLPIDSTSLQVGSNDGGAHVFANHPAVVEACNELFASFNLKRHRIASSGVELRSAGDVEAHLADDGVIYLLDLARLMPPEYDHESVRRNPRGLFYRLLRPEFLVRYPVELCADAGTAWSERSEARAHVEECALATKFLFDEVVPRFAAELDESLSDLDDGASAEQLWHAAAELSGSAFHRFGINVRHVGRVRSHCSAAAARRRLLSVAVARALKNHVNAECRAIARQLTVPSSHPFISIVVAQCNVMLGGGGDASLDFWRKGVKTMLDASFRDVLDQDERDGNFDLRARVNVPLATLVMLRLVGASPSEALVGQLTAQPRAESIMVLDSDFEFKPRVKTPYLFVKAEALAHWLRSLDAELPLAGRIRLLSVATARFADIVERISWCPTLTYQASACQVCLAAALLCSTGTSSAVTELLLDASAKLRALIYYSSSTICRYAFSEQAHAVLCEQSARLAEAILKRIDGNHPVCAALQDHIESPSLHSSLFPSLIVCGSSASSNEEKRRQTDRGVDRLSAYEFRVRFESAIHEISTS